MLTLCDPQTNGGLLLAVAEDDAEAFVATFNEAILIGKFTEKESAVVEVC